MKPSYFDYDTRAIINLDYWWDMGVVVTRVNTPQEHRNKGVMRKLMFEMLNDADREQVKLSLWINEYGDMTREQLADWYRRLGFVDVPRDGIDEPGLFVRMPVKRGTQPCPVCGESAYSGGGSATADYHSSGIPAERLYGYEPCGCVVVKQRGRRCETITPTNLQGMFYKSDQLTKETNAGSG